jgi:hypothetical protein
MDMRSSDKKALDILLRDEQVKRDDVLEIFHQYLKDCNPNAPSPMSKVFDIVVNYFKPENISLNELDKETQRKLTLYLLARGVDKDMTLEQYIKEQKELEAMGIKTKQEKAVKNDHIAECEKRIEKIVELDKERKKTGVDPNIAKQPDANGREAYNVSEVVFTFSVTEHKDKFSGETSYTFSWSLDDPVTGTKQTGSRKTTDLSVLGTEKATLVNGFLGLRGGIMQAKKNGLQRDVNQLDREEINNQSKLDGNEYYIKNYESAKNAMSDRYANEQAEIMRKMRDELREEHRHVAKGGGLT